MNAIEMLHRDLLKVFPEADAELDRPAVDHGHWYLNVMLGQHEVVVDWQPNVGFGVTSAPFSGYGEGPEEVFAELETVRERVADLLRTKGRTRPPKGVLLRNLREELHLTQTELADLLGVQQPAVAKMEKRRDMAISSLQKVVTAMGGTVEILARFPDGVLRIDQFD